MHMSWHEKFSEVICYGLEQDDIERMIAEADAGFTDEAIAPAREGVFNNEPLDD